MYKEMIKEDRKFAAFARQYDESFEQEERYPRMYLVCDSTHHQVSATHRSAHQDVQGAAGRMS